MRQLILALFPTLLLALLVLASPASAGWWDDLDRGEAVRLNDVIAQPSRYKDRVVSFFCVMHRPDEVFAPLAAPFTPRRHVNFAVWPDGAPLWEQESYGEGSYPFLYISRAHPQVTELLALEPFTRIEVTARPRGMIRARPCLDVVSFRRTSHRLGLQVVKSIMAGDRHAEEGRPDLAYENYRRALQPDLPPSYELLVRKRVAEGLRRLGRDVEARMLEGGEILGGSEAPTASPRRPGGLLGDPLPGMPGMPGSPTADEAPTPITTDDLPGQPVGSGPLTNDLPGVPAGPSAPPVLPTIPPPVLPSFPPPVSPAAPPPVSPAAPPPVTTDLPGVPASEAPRDPPPAAPAPPPTPPPVVPATPPVVPPALPPVVPPAAPPPVPPTLPPTGSLPPIVTPDSGPPPVPPKPPPPKEGEEEEPPPVPPSRVPPGAPPRHSPRMSGVK